MAPLYLTLPDPSLAYPTLRTKQSELCHPIRTVPVPKAIIEAPRPWLAATIDQSYKPMSYFDPSVRYRERQSERKKAIGGHVPNGARYLC